MNWIEWTAIPLGLIAFAIFVWLCWGAGSLTRGADYTNSEKDEDIKRVTNVKDSMRHELDYMREDGTI